MPRKHSVTNDFDDFDVDWHALNYVLGELDSIESEKFELRLADDITAQENLANAVDLVQKLRSLETAEQNSVGLAGVFDNDFVSSETSSQELVGQETSGQFEATQSAGWLWVIAFAASILGVIGILNLNWDSVEQSPITSNESTPAEDSVALAWLNSLPGSPDFSRSVSDSAETNRNLQEDDLFNDDLDGPESLLLSDDEFSEEGDMNDVISFTSNTDDVSWMLDAIRNESADDEDAEDVDNDTPENKKLKKKKIDDIEHKKRARQFRELELLFVPSLG